MPNLDASLCGVVLGERYRLERSLARGGMGTVYEALQIGLGRKVAVKVMHPFLGDDAQSIARFEREAQLVAGLGHPNIAQVLDSRRATGGQPAWIAMELIVGQSLAQVLRAEGALAVERVVAILLGILSALEAAHAIGAVHRDLKPGNVMIGQVTGVGEVAKVLDFGIAKLMEGDGYDRLTKSGVVLGTPMYMSPEQALAETVDARTDVYAAGLIGWVMLAGRVPFPREPATATLHAVVEMIPSSLSLLRPDVPAALDAILACALAKHADARFQSARAMAEALRGISTAAPRSSAPAAVSARPSMGSGSPRPLRSVARNAPTLMSQHARLPEPPVHFTVPPIPETVAFSAPTPAPPVTAARLADGASLQGLRMAAASFVGAVVAIGAVVALVGVAWVVRSSFFAQEAPPGASSTAGPTLVAAPNYGSEYVRSAYPRDGTMHQVAEHARSVLPSGGAGACLASVTAACIRADGRVAWDTGPSCNWIFHFRGADGRLLAAVVDTAASPYPALLSDRSYLASLENTMPPCPTGGYPDSDVVMAAATQSAPCPAAALGTIEASIQYMDKVTVYAPPLMWSADVTPSGLAHATGQCL